MKRREVVNRLLSGFGMLGIGLMSMSVSTVDNDCDWEVFFVKLPNKMPKDLVNHIINGLNESGAEKKKWFIGLAVDGAEVEVMKATGLKATDIKGIVEELKKEFNFGKTKNT